MEDFERLKMISLKEKVGRELILHLGISQEVLIEFLIEEARNSENEDEFFSKLNRQDESFTVDLASSIYFLVHGLLEEEQKQVSQTKELPTQNGEETIAEQNNLEGNVEEGSEKKHANLGKQFPGLAIQNKTALKILNEEEIILEVSAETVDKKKKKKKKSKKKSKKKEKAKRKRNLEISV